MKLSITLLIKILIILPFSFCYDFPDYIDKFNVLVNVSEIGKGEWKENCSMIQENSKNSACLSTHCLRYVQDSFIDNQTVAKLLIMMEKGMQSSVSTDTGGPTILDINSGYLMDAEGLVNIYQPHRGRDRVYFTKEEYKLYRELFTKIKHKIQAVFDISELYFTAPTFVARITGKDEWIPLQEHDKYYMPHVDKDNTDHYFYSGLVYLSNYGADFRGGEFLFLDKIQGSNETNATAILPRKGRFITFQSGKQNLHKVNKVFSGTRYTLSMWFTCDPSKKFKTFLDGKVHQSFEKYEEKEL